MEEAAFAPIFIQLEKIARLAAEAKELRRMIAELEMRIAKELTFAHRKHAALAADKRMN